jgi:hypothetical protein
LAAPEFVYANEPHDIQESTHVLAAAANVWIDREMELLVDPCVYLQYVYARSINYSMVVGQKNVLASSEHI